MTPFGEKMRAMRRKKGVSQQEMAKSLGVSSAYLSALEHGHRGRPAWAFQQRVIGYFNIIWDDAEELQELAAISHPRVTIDTSGLEASATRLANLLAGSIGDLENSEIDELIAYIEQRLKKPS